MKKFTNYLLTAVFFTVIIAGCASKPAPKSEFKNHPYYAENNGFSTNFIEIVTVPTEEKDSVFAKASAESPVDLFAFYIAQTETTYARWYEVYTWATKNGYKFANPGREGNAGVDGAAPTGSDLPVTMISWRDAVVWCNAASEKDGLTPVYKYKGAVLKESDTAKDGEGKAENSVADAKANGYRLPSEGEWEFAARGGNPSSEIWKNTASEKPASVAWFADNSDGKTHDVKTKAVNTFGMYDMSGNVWEWCNDTWSSNAARHAMRGGSYRKSAEGVTVVSRDYAPVSKVYDDVGFRVAKTTLSMRDAK